MSHWSARLRFNGSAEPSNVLRDGVHDHPQTFRGTVCVSRVLRARHLQTVPRNRSHVLIRCVDPYPRCHRIIGGPTGVVRSLSQAAPRNHLPRAERVHLCVSNDGARPSGLPPVSRACPSSKRFRGTAGCPTGVVRLSHLQTARQGHRFPCRATLSMIPQMVLRNRERAHGGAVSSSRTVPRNRECAHGGAVSSSRTVPRNVVARGLGVLVHP